MILQPTRRRALVALPLCLALLGGAAALPGNALASTFDDVTGHWAESDGWIDYVQSKGLMKGYDGTNEFGPNNQLTRAEIAVVLYRMAGGSPSGNPGFYDVRQGSWYYNAVSWCKASGIITGYPDGSFQPDKPVRRAELATMAYRFAKWSGANVSASDAAYYETEDTGLIDRPGNEFSYARDALVWTCDRGVLNGKFDDAGFAWLDAQYTATRGEAAKIFTVLKRDVIDRSGSFTVTFNANGGSAVNAQKVASGSKATRPADPTRKGYTFVNWYSDAALTRAFNFYSDVTGNVTLYAKWERATSANALEAEEMAESTEATMPNGEPDGIDAQQGQEEAVRSDTEADGDAPQDTDAEETTDETEEPGAADGADEPEEPASPDEAAAAEGPKEPEEPADASDTDDTDDAPAHSNSEDARVASETA